MNFARCTAVLLSVIFSFFSIASASSESKAETRLSLDTNAMSTARLDNRSADSITAHHSFYSEVTEEEHASSDRKVNDYLTFAAGPVVPVTIFSRSVSYTNINPASRSPLLRQSSGLAPPHSFRQA